MSYKVLEHATDAFIEVTADTRKDAFEVVANSIIETTLDRLTVEEKELKEIVASGKDLRYLLFSWIEEIVFLLITEGFAISRVTKLELKEDNKQYEIRAMFSGEPIDITKHKFKVEIKAPTFHEMEIKESDKVKMRFLMDL